MQTNQDKETSEKLSGRCGISSRFSGAKEHKNDGNLFVGLAVKQKPSKL